MINRLNVLIVEDNADDALLLARHLSKNGLAIRHRVVDTIAALRDALADTDWQVILSDYSLPDCNALTVLREVAATRKHIPVIVVSGAVGDEKLVELIHAGAQDFVAKDKLNHLIPAIERSLEVIAYRRERERTQQELETKTLFLDAVLDNIQDGIVACDADGNLTLLNHARRNFHSDAELSCGPEDWAERFDLYLPDGKTPMTTAQIPLYRALVDGSVRDVELVIAPKNSSPRTLIANGCAMFDDDGEKLGAVVSMHDITEQRKKEAALRESEHLFREAFSTAPHGMALVSTDGKWLNVNSALCDMLGYSESELLELNFQSITHPDDLGVGLSYLQQMLDGKIDSYQTEKRYIRKNGDPLTVLLSGSVVRDSAGEPEYFISQIFDLTERRDIEAQLLQAQKMEAVGQLTGGIAHDFNNLLTVILGNAQLIARKVAEDEKLSARAAAISESAKRGAELVQHMLAFSRKQTLDSAAVNVNALIEGMLDMLRRSLTELVEIKPVFASGLYPAFVDDGQLENAILNLSINARDAMPAGGTLTIATEKVEFDEANPAPANDLPAGRYVVVSVSDTGTGISDENIKRIFEPFYTTKEVGKGTGLGLSMVHGFVNQSGGHIEIDSCEGSGTTFRLYLPAAEASVEQRDAAASRGRSGLGGDETILVVEDEDAVRDLAVTMLKEMGYRVVEARNGPAALAALEDQSSVDLLFTDIVMPGGMTGVVLAEKVRRRRPQIKILYTSGYNETSLLESGSSEIAQNTLAKPYEESELAQRIRAALDAH